MIGRRALIATVLAASASGCAAVHKTDILRKDVLTDAQEAIATAELDHGGLTVAGSVDRADTTYDPDQPITLRVQTNKNAYVAIFRVLGSGETTLLFPNRGHRKAAITANSVLTVPAPDDAVKIVADKPGIVLFEFVASTAGDAWPFNRAPDDGSDFAALGTTTRALAKDLLDGLKVGSGHETAAAYVTVRINGGGLF
ncbi:MAG TPA: DUF4384 domain-containing protein [Stellaceae bacterium]|jgi:hypothetical protein|nr:DUF4384 domain-containing protein [Stellaceae bacterium]